MNIAPPNLRLSIHGLWSFWFALCAVSLRCWLSPFEFSVDDLFILTLQELAIGFILSAIVFPLTIVFQVLVILVVALTLVASFQYEAFFGQLPDTAILYYVRDLEHLAPSLLAWANLETAALLVVFAAALILPLSSLRQHFPAADRQVTLLLALLTIGLMFAFGSTRLEGRTADPFAWWISSWSARYQQVYQVGEIELNHQNLTEFRTLHGLPDGEIPDARFPLCRADEPTLNGNGKNVILLLLEGVGTQELALMPNLTDIAQNNLWFRQFKAAGTKSIEALPAVFSGLPVNPLEQWLWRRPLVNTESFVQTLSSKGYRTAFFHGSDLSFEQQRQYLKTSGFLHIRELGDFDHPVYGWGYDDGVMLDELRRWIEDQHSPYFATLTTLSTHHPNILPPSWRNELETVVPYSGRHAAAVEDSYIYLDHQLGRFYAWVANQPDTVLVLVGDHGPIIAGMEHEFDVPLVITGLPNEVAATLQQYTSRIGAAHDLPATIMGLLEQAPPNCSLGLNLLATGTFADRVIPAAGGASAESYVMFDGQDAFIFNRLDNQFYTPGAESLTQRRPIIMEQVPAHIINFFQTSVLTHRYLLEHDGYAPRRQSQPVTPRRQVTSPIFVSHRGNTSGADVATENSKTALDRVLESGMQWVEVDVQADRNGEPFLHHDPFVEIDRNRIAFHTLTIDEIRALPGFDEILTLEEALAQYSDKLNFLIEAKPIDHVATLLPSLKRIRDVINDRRSNNRVIVDSFNPVAVQSIGRDCRCEIGIDHPFRQPVDNNSLAHYADLGYDWVYIEHAVYSPQLMKRAHQHGLKIMVYTLNTSDELAEVSGYWPDGIITDNASLIDHHNAH